MLCLVLDKPGYRTSIHITIYLTTSGRDPDFVKDLVHLQDTIDFINDKYPEASIYICGDANAATTPRKCNKRDEVFKYFISENNLLPININHKTYHHFTNNGLSDSCIDVLLQPATDNSNTEFLEKILCMKTNSLIDSNHDALISTLTLTHQETSKSLDNIPVAPKIEHMKHKIVWSTEGIKNYQNLLLKTLPTLQHDYSDVHTHEEASILFKISNHILTKAVFSWLRDLNIKNLLFLQKLPRLLRLNLLLLVVML